MASNRAWYENVFKNGMRRFTGGNEIAESNPLDWERLRILKDGKLVPAMRKGHIGPPTDWDLDLLRTAADSGNVFLYRMGEVYPQRYMDGEWYSTDPAVNEKRPELQVPPLPQEPAAGDEAAQAAYQQQLKTYEEDRDRLQQKYDAEFQEWEKSARGFNSLNIEQKTFIRNEEPNRATEIMQNREVQRAAEIDRKPVMDWYQNEFRTNIVRPNADKKLADTEGMDWSRMRIWDGEKFARVLPEGHTGAPTTEALKNLRDAVQSGNLFMYQPADKYPSKWMGNHWRSMDKNWIESLNPAPLVENPAPKMTLNEPQLENFTRDISQRKLATNRFFSRFRIKAYQSEVDNYNQAVEFYQKALTEYEEVKAAHEQAMELYNEERRIQQELYNQRLGTYESMRKSYEALTPAQIAAMEQDVQLRTEEIKRNKEAEQKIANELTENVRNEQVQLENAERRVEMLNAQPQQERFVGGPAALGEDVYKAIAPHGYALPDNSKISIRDAAAIHMALAGSVQAATERGISPANAKQYGQLLDGVLQGAPSAEGLQYIVASYDAANNCISTYTDGNPAVLAEAMGEGLRNLINVSRDKLQLTPEMTGIAMVTDRILKVMDKDPELVKNCGLNEEELNFARGLAELGRIHSNFLEAQVKLTETATGAKTLPKEQMLEHTVNFMFGQLVGNHLRNGTAQEKEAFMATLGAGKGNALKVAAEVYKADPKIQEAALKQTNLMNPKLEDRGKELAQAVIDGELNKPKESKQVKETARERIVRELRRQEIERNKTAADIKLENELKKVRSLMAESDPAFENVDITDDRIKEKRQELDTISAYLGTKNIWAENGDMLSFDDPKVLAEAADRARVRELMERDNAQADKAINFTTITKRLEDMKAAKQELAARNEEHELFSDTVYNRAKEIQQARELKTRLAVEDPARTVWVLEQELGRTLDWKSSAVQTRMGQLQAARAQLGNGFEQLALNDPQVIQKDYQIRGVNPLRDGLIVDTASLSPEALQDYTERTQTIEYLRSMGETSVYKNASRYSEQVSKTVAELKAARTLYETSIEEPQRDLPLNDPKIGAMLMFSRASGGRSFTRNMKNADLDSLAAALRGKNLADGQKEALKQLGDRDPSFRLPGVNQQIQGQPLNLQIPNVQPVVQAPPVQGPPIG